MLDIFLWVWYNNLLWGRFAPFLFIDFAENFMATRRPRRREPFVIKPLDWVAPDVARDESEKDENRAKQPAPAKEQED